MAFNAAPVRFKVEGRGGHDGAGDGVRCRRLQLGRGQPCGARRGRLAQRARGGSSAPPQPLRAGERFVELKMAEALPFASRDLW